MRGGRPPLQGRGAVLRTSVGRLDPAVGVVAFLWGLQFAFLTPALALLLVSLFGASTAQVALVLVVYNSAALLSSWAVPRWADRRADYLRPMLGCAVLTIALAVALTFAGSLLAGVVGLVLLGAPAAVGAPLLFGHVRHSGAPPSSVVSTRAVFAAAWVAGPPVAAALIAWAGGEALVLAIGGVGATNLVAITVLLGRHRRLPVPPVDPDAPPPAAPLVTPRTALVLLVVAFAGLQATNSASVAVLTLFVTQTLDESAVWGGVALGVAAALEVPALLLLARRPSRIKDLPLLTGACVVGALYYLGVALAPGAIALVALQLLNAAFYAVVAGTGLTLFQALVAGPGAAAGLLSNAQRAGALLSGPLIALGSVGGWGLRTVFVACAAVATASLVLIRLAERRLPAAPP